MPNEAPDAAPDVFLCHNSLEKEAVRTINEILRQEYGLTTYLDEATLVGGEAWEEAIQRALARAKACAVIVGPHGWGKYQRDNEVRPAVQRRERDPAFRVVPVLLPGANMEALAEFGDFFSRTHWVTFRDSPDEPIAIRTLTYALGGENAFPEGPPRLTLSRIRFDAIRWDTGSRRDVSLLYTGKVLRDAAALMNDAAPPLAGEFLAASLRHHNQALARQLSAHASVMWSDPRRRDLAARLALESVKRSPTAEGVEVLRQAYAMLHRRAGTLTHPAPVTAAARHSTGGGLATGCSDGSVGVWDGRTLRMVGKHTDTVRAVADLGNGRFVTGAADGTCIIWDWASGEQIRTFTAGSTVETLDVRRTGDRTVLLTSGGFPGRPGDVAVWDADEGTERWRMGMVMHAALDGAGMQAAVAWGDHVVARRVEDGELAGKQPMNATVIGVAAHPNQPWIAATTFDRRAVLISFTSDPPECRELGAGTSRVSPIRISPDGRYVAAVRDDFQIVMWDLRDWSRRLFKYEGLMSVDIQFSDDTRYLAVTSPEAKAVTVWRVDDGQHVCTIEQDTPSLAVFDDRRNGLWTASDGAVVSFFEMPRQSDSYSTAAPGITTALAYGPGGTLAWCGYPVGPDLRVVVGDVALWVADPMTGVTRVDAKLSEAGRIAFDATGGRVAVAGTERVRVWDLATGEEIPLPDDPFWSEPAGPADSPAVSELLAAPAVVAACEQRGRVGTLASPDARVVAIDHGSQMVSLWNTATTTEIVWFSTVAPVARMAFSADGSLFAAGDSRGGVMLWQTNGTSLGQVKHDEPISHLAFSPDGNFLAVASMDSALRIWIASPGVLADSVRAKVSGPLTDDEWARYLGDEPRTA